MSHKNDTRFTWFNTVECFKSEVLEVLFQRIKNLNYREVDIKKYKIQKDYFHFFSPSNKSFECVDETFFLRAQDICYYRQLVK